MLEKTKSKIDELLKAATDPEAIEALGQCAQEIAGEIKRNEDREGLIKRQADTIRNAYLHTAVEQKGEDEGKKEAKKSLTLKWQSKRHAPATPHKPKPPTG